MAVDFTTTRTGSALSSIGRTATSAATGGVDGSAFASALNSLVESVETTAADANVAVTNMIDKNGDVHEAMIALQRAETALQFTVQVRNKFVTAYQEIMRMPI